jgi:hypothetical protein
MEVKRGLNTLAAGMTAANKTSSSSSGSGSSSGASALTSSAANSEVMKVLADLAQQKITEASLAEHLQKAVEKFESDTLVQNALDKAANDASGAGGAKRRKLFLVPDTRLWQHPLVPVVAVVKSESADVMDLTSSDDPYPLGSQLTEVSVSQGAVLPTSSAAGGTTGTGTGTRKRSAAQMSRANTADTTTSSSSSRPDPFTATAAPRWLALTLSAVVTTAAATAAAAAAAATSSAEHAGNTQQSAQSQLDSVQTGALPNAISAYILI